MATNALAEAIVREATSSASGRGDTSYREFRSKASRGGEHFASPSRDDVFWRYVTGRAPILKSELGHERLATLSESEHRTLSKATGPAGGYLVPQDFDNLVTSARRARSVIGELARVVETDHGRALPLPAATSHGTASWITENAATVASDETFAQVTLNAYKAAANVIVSQELAQDAIDDFDVFLADELGQRAGMLEEAAFAQGDGSGKPLGVVHASSGVATVPAANGSTTRFTLADFASAFAALPPAYRANASWVISPSAFLNAASATDSAGAPAIPSLHAAQPTLFARPVYVSAELPASAASARSCVVGDFSLGYAIRRQRGLGVKRLVELYSNQGQIGYLLFSRVDGRPVLTDALRILVHSAT